MRTCKNKELCPLQGGWLSPQGEYFPCSRVEHESTAEKIVWGEFDILQNMENETPVLEKAKETILKLKNQNLLHISSTLILQNLGWISVSLNDGWYNPGDDIFASWKAGFRGSVAFEDRMNAEIRPTTQQQYWLSDHGFSLSSDF